MQPQRQFEHWHRNDGASRILDTLHSAILCLDQNRCLTYANAASEALFENSIENLIGRHFESLLSTAEPSSILERLDGGDISAFTDHEATITLGNGKSILADYSIYPYSDHQDSDGIVIKIRQLDYQAQFAQDEHNEMQKHATQQLARGLAHEINNPLGGIRGAAQLLHRELEREVDRPDWKEYIEVIISEVDRLQSLTANMLGPGNRLQISQINILEVLEHIRKIICAAEPDRIEIIRDYDPSIPELMADRDMLIQAFLNIARNAVQAIDGEGRITFRTRIDRQFTIGQVTHRLVLLVDITDSGRGIPKEIAETIFLPTITDKPDGSGLGLPIAQDIISRHNGTIHLHSTEAGTTFRTILPLDKL